MATSGHSRRFPEARRDEAPGRKELRRSQGRAAWMLTERLPTTSGMNGTGRCRAGSGGARDGNTERTDPTARIRIYLGGGAPSVDRCRSGSLLKRSARVCCRRTRLPAIRGLLRKPCRRAQIGARMEGNAPACLYRDPAQDALRWKLVSKGKERQQQQARDHPVALQRRSGQLAPREQHKDRGDRRTPQGSRDDFRQGMVAQHPARGGNGERDSRTQSDRGGTQPGSVGSDEQRTGGRAEQERQRGMSAQAGAVPSGRVPSRNHVQQPAQRHAAGRQQHGDQPPPAGAPGRRGRDQPHEKQHRARHQHGTIAEVDQCMPDADHRQFKPVPDWVESREPAPATAKWPLSMRDVGSGHSRKLAAPSTPGFCHRCVRLPVCMYCGSGTLCDADHGIPAGGDGCLKAAAFFNELKRRNVLRAGTFYVAAAWALSQGLAQLLPVFNAPNWITQWFVIACVIGFPFWVTFAWFYEFTPTGLKLESEIAPGDSIQEHTGKRADRWIIATLSVAVVLLITNTFVLHRDANSQADVADAKAIAATLAKVPKQSVAVLPFGNESGDPKQQYFSDGLSEELISELTQVNGLKVIGKYSSFKFRDSKDSPAQIGAALEVANLIQGSVFQQGNQIRVTVGMIRARDGASLWSQDRKSTRLN